MNKKSLCILTAAALLSGVAGTATAGSIYAAGTLSGLRFTPHVLPVLVKVNDQGEITKLSSAYQLKPQYRRLLHKTLDEMITAPAHKDGHGIASQFVINMAAKTTPRTDGKYNLSFVYVSTMPVPFGSWYWGHIDGRKLALIDQDRIFPQRRYHHRYNAPRHFYRPTMHRSQPMQQSRSAPASRGRPAAHAPRPHGK